MTDNSISFVANLITVFFALAIGTRLGYIVAARGTAHHIDLIDRHFENSRRLFEHQQDIQRQTDAHRRSREELKDSYEALGIWLHRLGQTLDEIYFGAVSDKQPMRDKAEALISVRPWEVVSPPTSTAAAAFYWSPEVLRKIRELQGPYAQFVAHIRLTMLPTESDDAPASSRPEQGCWQQWQELQSLIASIKSQARADLMPTSPTVNER
ncbi:hypothetical protein EJC51_47130 [Streptomyces aquilus]|uniref:Uncharacterized protein n=1 Tax=Streptomyces aquilus TaxID=2548456 RepID=A0A3Q9BXH3_9ACTN|nr:hypothetical protein [Streptomyces aquilus]AZP14763.1 hypothetical protein EJC51_00415 [Streptomyces aquilus]AZP22941.1 hypothetical protein EJC51_47130 [Streptomyces aquilus]